MFRNIFYLCIGAFLAISAFADQETIDVFFGENPIPWTTGPLLTPSGRTENAGHFKLQPYLNTFVKVGEYDAHWHAHSIPNFYSEQVRVLVKYGITSFLDVQVAPYVLYNETQGRHSFNVGDLPLGFNIQLRSFKQLGSGPAIKLGFATHVPLGKYRNLHPSLLRTDISGKGCWFPEASLVVSDIWHLYGAHYIKMRSAIFYAVGVPVHVKGFNFYGGDRFTNGTVYPGNYILFTSALEFSVTQRWVLACDFQYTHQNRDRFSGKTVAYVGRPSAEIISIAPALEYNWSRDLGMIGGVWFTLAGRNTPQFINNIIYINAYF